VSALLEVARFRGRARRAGLDEVVLAGAQVRFHPVELPESRALRLARLYPGTVVKPAVRTILVPRPTEAGAARTSRGDGLRDLDLLAWAAEVIGVIDPSTDDGSAT